MTRLKAELDELETELHELEKKEMPSNLNADNYSAKAQLKDVDELRRYMREVVSSASFTNLEDRRHLSFQAIEGMQDLNIQQA